MIYLLLVIFQVKHFLADYPLQGEYMLGKFKSGNEYIEPLLAHCAVHVFFTAYITFLFTNNWNKVLICSIFDLIMHFTMDRIKASPEMLGRYKSMTKNDFEVYKQDQKMLEEKWEKEQLNLSDYLKDCLVLENDWKDMKKSNKYFWWSLGLDQSVHHLTHYAIIWMILK